MRWIWRLAIPLAMTLVLLVGAQVPPDEAARLLEEMKQRDALARADRLERRLEEAQKEIERLTAELAATKAALDESKQTNEAVRARVRELEDQLAFLGVNQISSSDESVEGPQEVSARQIQIVGDRFVGKSVKLSNCRFATAHGNYTDIVPDIEVLSDGRARVLRQNSPDRWIGLIVLDSAGNHFFHAYAPKDQFADVLLGMSRGTRLNLTGFIAPMLKSGDETSDRYLLICSSIEPVS